MGGVWERQIRSVRKVLQAVVKEQHVDDESLPTLMCLVESIINGRPLTTVSDDHRDLEPLTPNHLLLLRPDAIVPRDQFVKEDLYCRKRWRQVQFLADLFWRRWIREYLPTLQLRKKWIAPVRNFEVGDVVVIIDNNAPRNVWQLGRATQTFRGPDGLVRSLELVTKPAMLVQPVNKICLIETADILIVQYNSCWLNVFILTFKGPGCYGRYVRVVLAVIIYRASLCLSQSYPGLDGYCVGRMR